MDIDPHNRLRGVEPRLVACVQAAAKVCKQPFVVVQGVRTVAEQAAMYAQGRTKPGPVVTWKDGIVHPSNHQPHADGYGHAVDLAALENDGSIDWRTSADYLTIKASMFAAADAMAPPLGLRWGGDFGDQDHFEIVDLKAGERR